MDDFLEKLNNALTKIEKIVMERATELIEKKIDELYHTVATHQNDLILLNSELEKMKEKLEEGIQDPKQKDKISEKLDLAHSELSHIIAQKGKEYKDGTVAVGLSIDVKRTAESILMMTGIEVIRNQDWVVKKAPGVSLQDHLYSSFENKRMVSQLGKQKKSA